MAGEDMDGGLSRRALFGLGVTRASERVDRYREELTELAAADRASAATAVSEPFDAGWDLPDTAGASALLAPAAEALVEACGVTAGERVLDCASGDGNVARAAARRGAHVTALDSAPAALERGRAGAEAAGIEWVEGDAQALPFADGELDHALSCFGVIWAADARRAIAELFRVTRPGGRVGLTLWTAGGLAGRVLRTASQRVPLGPPGTPLPTAWGREERLRQDLELLADDLRPRFADLSLDGAPGFGELVTGSPGPIAAGARALDAEGREALRKDIEALVAGRDAPLATPYLELVATVAER